MAQLFTYSIFYHQNEFYKILKHLELYVGFDFDKTNYYIKISDFRGPHLELTIILDKDIPLVYLYSLSDNLLLFLKKEPSSNLGLEKTSHELFDDFPNNTIHYGIRNWIVPFWGQNLSGKHHSKITSIICTIFQEYQVDTIANLTEIALQVLGVFCAASKKDLKTLKKIISVWIKMERSGYNDKTLEEIDKLITQNYKDNGEIIISYLNGIILGRKKLAGDWQIMWFDFIIQFVDNPNIDITIFPRLMFETLDYKESIVALGMFSMVLADLKKQI